MTVDLSAGTTLTGTSRQERFTSIENVVGSANGDRISGSSVANRITGADGLDVLTGRGGADQFVFNFYGHARIVTNQAEIISDFSRSGGDRINLNAIDANTRVSGNQDFRFITGEFSGRGAEVRFDGDFVLVDGNADGRADMRILMQGIDGMSASDFIL